jgi:hypothetical protein
MLDDNKKHILAWFFGHFWGRCAGVLAGLALLGFLLGLCKMPRLGRGPELVSVLDLNKAPGAYDAKPVCVRGEVLDLRVEDNKLVRPYTVFSLQETAPDGSYDFINVISLRLPAFGKGTRVKACGYFNKIKQVGKDTYYNSVLMNKFEEELSPEK